MDYLIDKYLKKPDYIKALFEKPVTISLKIDGSAFQIFYNKEEDKIEYHKRGGSSSKLGPIIDEYTQLFTKHLNDAIDYFADKEEILKENKFYAIEIFNDMYVLLNVIDNNDKVLTDIKPIANELDIESLPILFDNQVLPKESQEDLISMCTLAENTTNKDFIVLLKKVFGSGDYERFLKGDEIEGIVLTWIIDDKPVQYKIINPAFKTRHDAEQKSKLEEAEKDTEQLNKLIESLYNRLKDVAKYREDNWIKNLDANFFEMCSDQNWLHDVKDIAKEITPNTNKWFTLQINKVSKVIKELIDHNGDEMKTIYEKYLMTFNKPKKRAFIISKEFQNNINNIIERLQSKNESLKIYSKYHMKSLNQFINEKLSANLEKEKNRLPKIHDSDLNIDFWKNNVCKLNINNTIEILDDTINAHLHEYKKYSKKMSFIEYLKSNKSSYYLKYLFNSIDFLSDFCETYNKLESIDDKQKYLLSDEVINNLNTSRDSLYKNYGGLKSFVLNDNYNDKLYFIKEIKNEYCVHFMANGEETIGTFKFNKTKIHDYIDILKNGFTKGTPYPNDITSNPESIEKLYKSVSNTKENNGINFAYELDYANQNFKDQYNNTRKKQYHSKYGYLGLIFKCDGIVVYHSDDREYQVLFDGSSVSKIIPIYANYVKNIYGIIKNPTILSLEKYNNMQFEKKFNTWDELLKFIQK